MSHVVTVKCEMKDADAIRAAIERLPSVKMLEGGRITEHRMYGGQKATGIGIHLEGWNHPVVINPETGECKYDNYGGSWGAQIRLDELVQGYSIEKVKLEAYARGQMFEEQKLDNGDVKVTVSAYS